MPRNTDLFTDPANTPAVPNYTGDGVKTIFATTFDFISGSTSVYINGVLCAKTEYSEGSDLKSIVFVTPPALGYELAIIYVKSPSAVSATIAPSDLKEQMADDFVNVFLNENEFSESITYIPSGGTAKQIYGIITRNRIEPDQQGHSKSLMNQVIIDIANDPTYGVVTINKGQDKVSLPAIKGLLKGILIV